MHSYKPGHSVKVKTLKEMEFYKRNTYYSDTTHCGWASDILRLLGTTIKIAGITPRGNIEIAGEYFIISPDWVKPINLINFKSLY